MSRIKQDNAKGGNLPREPADRRGKVGPEPSHGNFQELSFELQGVHSQGVWVGMNVSGARLLGVAGPKEAIGAPVLDFVPEGLKEEVRSRIGKASKQEWLKLYESKVLRPDGTIVDVEVTTMGVLHEGKPATQIFMRDITGRKQAEKALRQSQELLRVAFDKSPVGAVITDPDFRCVRVNDAFCAFIGYSAEEIAGLSFKDLIHQDDSAESLSRSLGVLKGETDHFHMDKRYIRKDGTVVWGRLSARPITYAAGRVRYLLSIVEDITERKHGEEALRKARDELEERVRLRTAELEAAYTALKDEMEKTGRAEQEQLRLSAIVESTDDAIMSVDLEGRITSWNKGAEQVYGYAAGEIVSLPASVLLPPGRWRENHLLMGDVARGKPVEHHETERITKDRKTIVVSLSLSPLKDRKGRIIGASDISRDITEHKRAEEALRLANAYNRSLIEASLDLLFTIDPEGRINDVNAATERVTGYSRKELIGTYFSGYFTEPHRARDGYRRALEEGSARDYRLEVRHRDGHVTPVLYNASVYRDDRGNVRGVFNAARDMTALTRAEQQLRHAQKMEAMGTLSSGIAHDFNNILAAIMGFADLGLEDERDRAIRQYFAQILHAGERGKELVKRILTFSRNTEEERKPVQVIPLIEESIRMLRASLPATVEIRQVISAGQPIVVADPTQLQQVIVNLATNAAHAMREKGGVLEIGVTDSISRLPADALAPGAAAGPFLKLTVSDTGTGMDEKTMVRIFDPFFTTKQRGEGTGLGLSIVHGILESHGGAITVKSTLGKGSTFDVFLPRVAQISSRTEGSPTWVPKGRGEVLLVDDETALVELERQMINRLGYSVTAVDDSMEALALFREAPLRYDIVLSDQTMPNMTGIELARELIAIRPDIPIILVTGYSDAVDADYVKALGVKAFVMKPLTRMDLAQTIERVLKGQGASRDPAST